MTPDELSRRVLARLPARRLPHWARFAGWAALIAGGFLVGGFTQAGPIVPLGLAALIATVLILALGE